jgi:hypothetical protein
MKLKFLTVLAIAGMAIAGCGSDKSSESATDSGTVDTSMNAAPTTDTANMSSDSTTVDSAGTQSGGGTTGGGTSGGTSGGGTSGGTSGGGTQQ